MFRTLCDEGTTLLVATHDLALTRRRFDRCIAINGTLRGDGPPTAVLTEAVLDTVFGTAGHAVAVELGESSGGDTHPTGGR